MMLYCRRCLATNGVGAVSLSPDLSRLLSGAAGVDYPFDLLDAEAWVMDDPQGSGDIWVDPVDPVSRAFMVAYDEWSDEKRAIALGASPRGNLKKLRRTLNLAYKNLPPVTVLAEDPGRSRPGKTGRSLLGKSGRRYRGRREEEEEGDDL